MTNYPYGNIETTDATPNATSLIETFRAIGYDIETAIADIIDNSISAGATEVKLYFNWNGSDTSFYILDNGCGMSEKQLIEAMRPGTKNPLEQRGDKDLGRFGLGLKTASFSQCRHLTLVSKAVKSHLSYWSWDIDYVSQSGLWNLIKVEPSNEILEKLENLNSGTIVLWSSLDRVTKDYRRDDDSLKKFLVITERIKAHIGMIFHRFMESNQIKIWLQDEQVMPWSPFLTEQFRVQNFPLTHYSNGNIGVKGYVLQHKSAFTNVEFEAAGGRRGWNDQQGFYIYRNSRMLVSGNWLGLWAKEEHYKLARISIDISSSSDVEWQIDIKKAIARLPASLKDSIKKYAMEVRSLAASVYRAKGRPTIQGKDFLITSLWTEFTAPGTRKWSFKINRQHPLISETIRLAEIDASKAIKLLLRNLEETVPVKSIYIKEAEDGYNQAFPFEGVKKQEMIELMRHIFNTFLDSGLNNNQAKDKLRHLEPFNYHLDEIEKIDQ